MSGASAPVMGEALLFLGELFTGKDPRSKILIFTIPRPSGAKGIHLVTTPAEAAAVAEAESAKGERCTFVGCCTRTPRQYGPHERGKTEDAHEVFGLWLDTDPSTEGGDLAPCLELIEQMPLKPTMIVHSGNGAQAWWLFTTPQPAATIAPLVQRWTDYARTIDVPGAKVDATHDMARVMRVAGTVNAKAISIRKRAHLAQHCPAWRYGVAEVESALERAPATRVRLVGKNETPSSGGKQNRDHWQAFDDLSARSEPPALKLMSMVENDSKFKRSWNRNRTDFANQSQSSYDLSLASLALGAGWSDQEVAQLIVAHRAHHGQDTAKALRKNVQGNHDYLCRTIDAARKGAQGFLKDAEVAVVAQAEEALENQDDTIGMLRDMLGIPIEGGYRTTSRDGGECAISVRLAGYDRPTLIGAAKDLSNQKEFANRIFTDTGLVPTPVPGKRWHIVMRLISAVVVDETVPDGPVDRVRLAIEDYLDDNPPATGDDVTDAFLMGLPIAVDGQVGVTVRSLLDWMSLHAAETYRETTPAQKRSLLRVLGWVRKDTSRHSPEAKTTKTKSYWWFGSL